MEFYRSARTDDDCMLGLEFSGVSSTGERVMGMVKSGAMATQVQQIDHLTWIIPKDWSLRDGATIPAVYITVYYAFFFGKSVVRGNSILIHAGSGGIGLAGTFLINLMLNTLRKALQLKFHMLFHRNLISHTHCTCLWIRSVHHCFYATKTKVHIELIPTTQR